MQQTQGTVVSHNATFEPPHGNGEGNKVETTTEEIKMGMWQDEDSEEAHAGARMDMNFVCVSSHLVCNFMSGAWSSSRREGC